jgi:hypothetical protein
LIPINDGIINCTFRQDWIAMQPIKNLYFSQFGGVLSLAILFVTNSEFNKFQYPSKIHSKRICHLSCHMLLICANHSNVHFIQNNDSYGLVSGSSSRLDAASNHHFPIGHWILQPLAHPHYSYMMLWGYCIVNFNVIKSLCCKASMLRFCPLSDGW